MEAKGLQSIVPLDDLAVAGVTEVLPRAALILRRVRETVAAIQTSKPDAVITIDSSGFSWRVAHGLRRRGETLPLIHYVAPMVWAWRGGRARRMALWYDHLLTLLPFEPPYFEEVGLTATYVGHPVLEVSRLSRSDARNALGLTPYASAIAILPGSRDDEVRRLTVPMLEACEIVRRDRASVDSRLLLAPGLDRKTLAFAMAAAEAARVRAVDTDPLSGAYQYLGAFDAAMCASGTASLEAALARAMPVVAYKVGRVTHVLVRPRLRTPYVALPNILLGKPIFPELLQNDATVRGLSRALARVLDARDALAAAAAELEAILRPPSDSPSRAVARMLEEWL
jgi:lipid-A-disaccharide synthase